MIEAITKIMTDTSSTVLTAEELTQAHIDTLKHMILCSNSYVKKDISDEMRGLYLNEIRVAAVSLSMVIFHAVGRENPEALKATQLCNQYLAGAINTWGTASAKLREIEKMKTTDTARA